MTLKTLLFLLLSMCVSSVMAGEMCPRTDARNAWSEQEWSERCFERHDDVRKVKRAYLRNVRVGRSGATLILISETGELVAVGRDGAVRIPNIRYMGDFDLPNPDGIGRFYSPTTDASGKTGYRCGYYNQKNFKVIAEPKYADCRAFHDGTGFACIDCKTYCTDSDCHDKVHTDGQGVTLNRRGVVEQTGPLGTLDDVCDGPGSWSVNKVADNLMVLTCLREKPGPFDHIP